MRREELEVVWHGGLHREIPPDDQVLAARAAAATQVVYHRPKVDYGVRSATILAALGTWTDVLTLAARAGLHRRQIDGTLKYLRATNQVEIRKVQKNGASKPTYEYRRMQATAKMCVVCGVRWAQRYARCRACETSAAAPRQSAA